VRLGFDPPGREADEERQGQEQPENRRLAKRAADAAEMDEGRGETGEEVRIQRVDGGGVAEPAPRDDDEGGRCKDEWRTGIAKRRDRRGDRRQSERVYGQGQERIADEVQAGPRGGMTRQGSESPGRGGRDEKQDSKRDRRGFRRPRQTREVAER
jgi:hypothetical protein